MSRRRCIAALALAALALLPGRAVAAEWHSEQPLAGALGVPAALGPIGDVEFWAPNRGLLITAGNGGNPAGLFAYDGTGWYRYSTVCGGHDGRIAWAGPDEFWTISDQPNGQATGKAPPERLSLCHFKDGQVVASYAEPLGVAGSYLPMNAAACNGPGDCWFAGERLPGTTNVGAFHLHWNGTTLTPVPSLTEPQPELRDPGRAVWSLAFGGGNLYESVAVREGDVAPEEPEAEPSLLHRIVAGAASPFEPLATAQPLSFGNPRATAADMQPFQFAGDAEGLWALAGSESGRGKLTVLRLGEFGFEQLPLLDPEGFLRQGDRLGGAALEPQRDYAWAGVAQLEDEPPAPARLLRVHADGSVDPPILLPAEGEGIGRKGAAGPIACPGPEQCWMATTEGWLFHLGTSLPQDPDPAMHVLVEYRPPDNSLPSVPPISVPEDNSGSAAAAAQEEVPEAVFPGGRRARPLLAKVHQRLVGHVLELTFVLRARAHVQLLARRKGRVVAKTPRLTLARGKHRLHLRLDPKRWPTKLDFEVHRAGVGAR
ncbi:MAG: hypothetical protein ACTHKT_10005 [Solirubrobacterales bacterium]